MDSSEAGEDVMAEVAVASSAQDTDGLAVVRNGRDETSANTNQPLSAQTIHNPARARGPVSLSTTSQDSSQAFHQPSFGSANSKAHFGNAYTGTVTYNYNYGPPSQASNQSLFDNGALREDRFAGQGSARIKELKTRHRSARLGE